MEELNFRKLKLNWLCGFQNTETEYHRARWKILREQLGQEIYSKINSEFCEKQWKEYYTNYYIVNKERIHQRNAEKIHCECGLY